MLALVLLSLALATFSCRPKTESVVKGRDQLKGGAQGWNVVLISVDTLRADHLNSFGYTTRTTSPSIDRLTTSGVRFLEATAPRASTWPSLASVLTGLYPSGHGVYQNREDFDPDTPTLPRILSDEGYLTGAFLSNMCQAGHSGWQTRNCSRNSSDEDLLRNASSWLDQVAPIAADPSKVSETQAPVLLWAHFFGAHGPYFNGGEMGAQLDPNYQGVVAPKRGVLNRIMTEGVDLEDRDLEHLSALYDAAIIGTDARIERLLETVGDHLDLDRTVVVFLADHGEDLYEHNKYLYHACSVYQSALHVPLSISAPGLIAAGGAVTQPVELTDVLPTLLDLLGIDRSNRCLHGEPLLAYLAQPEREGVGKLALSEYGIAPIGTVRSGQWKLIENPTEHAEICLPNTGSDFYPIGKVELYDLAADPNEKHNLASRRPDQVEALSQARRSRVEGLCSTGVALTPADLSEEDIEAMEKLGYVVGRP